VGIEPDITIKEPDLTDEEQEGLKKIYKDKVIEEFIKLHEKPTNEDIDSFLNTLKEKGYVFTDRVMRRLLKNTLDYENSSAPIYDLEYDIQLQKAMEILTNGSIKYNKGEYSLK
jgi:carboxyl-terminal processing protease